MTVKIISMQMENVKRITAFWMEPSETGLTIIGGKNRQGKSSVLDGILWGMMSNANAPENPKRDGIHDPLIDITLSNGIRVKRSGKNSTLSVTDTTGQKGGLALVQKFVSPFALNLPAFYAATDKDRAKLLLKVLGCGDQLEAIDAEEKALFEERTTVGRMADAKEKYVAQMPFYSDAPAAPVSVTALAQEQREILARNQENDAARRELELLRENEANASEKIAAIKLQIKTLQESLKEWEADEKLFRQQVIEAEQAIRVDESTEAIEQRIANAEVNNAKFHAMQEKRAADKEAKDLRRQYDDLTAAIEAKRRDKANLLRSAELPLPDLSVESGALVYRGQKWDGMSGSEKMVVAAAIVRADNPECGFVLMDELEKMDSDTINEFAAWAEKEELQIIATRVTGDKDQCTVLIEDGIGGISNAD